MLLQYSRSRINYRTVSFFVFSSILLINFTSCVSYDSVAEGEMNSLYQVNGASIIMDQGVDPLVVLGIRNDSSGELLVKVRPIGGEIGWNFYSGGGSNFGSSDNTVRGAYLSSGNNGSLKPGDETLITIFLKNWYLANKNFKHRMEVVIDNGIEQHALNIYVTQDDIFNDAKKSFNDNKLGKNDPGRNGAAHIGMGTLPGNYSLTIPIN